VARGAARLDVDDGMEEPECLFAHGFFRRTGEAGSVDRRRRDPSARRGPATDPDDPPTSWASRRQGCEPCHGTVPAPTLRRLASAPLSGPGLMQRYSSARSSCQEQSKNIVSDAPSRGSRCDKRSALRSGMAGTGPAMTRERTRTGREPGRGKGPAVSFRGERQREPGSHHR
jgi:hypothetical protein